MSTDTQRLFMQQYGIADTFSPDERAVLVPGDCLTFLRSCPPAVFQLVVASPPYNVGKEYEEKLDLACYVRQQADIIRECARTLKPTGSICWQVGNYVDNGCIVPLDTILYPVFMECGMKMRNQGCDPCTTSRRPA